MIPRDPAILLSYVNTQLRDYFTTLDELCQAKDINCRDLEAQLETIDYRYDRQQNQFI